MSDITLLPLCECGCGEPVTKVGNRFIFNHDKRNKKVSNDTRKNMSEAQKEYHKNNPNAGSKHSKKLIQYYIDNPEAREAARLKSIEQMSNADVRDAVSKKSIEVWDDSDALKAASERMIAKWEDPAYRNNQTAALRQYYIDNPEARNKMSEIAKNSDSVKDAHKKQIGGGDMCWHHIAYDFGNSDTLRVKITRKFHGQIHHPKGIQFSVHGYSLID